MGVASGLGNTFGQLGQMSMDRDTYGSGLTWEERRKARRLNRRTRTTTIG